MISTIVKNILVILLSLPFTAYADTSSSIPPTPSLPKGGHSAYASINNVKIWYATYGRGKPVIFLHGGLADSNYWGKQIPVLAKQYQVIIMDSRGHGRSTHDDKPLSYDLMASDVLALMDYLKIKKAVIVGWSDGAVTGLKIAMSHPERISKLFAYGANSSPEAVNLSTDTLEFETFVNERSKKEYEKLSQSSKDFDNLLKQTIAMWKTQPHITKEQLRRIQVPTWIVGGDHDEAIKREDTEMMAAEIPGAGLLIEANVGHFAFLEDPEQFNSDLIHFLEV